MSTTTIAVTMGDPYGIGAETLSDVLQEQQGFSDISLVAIGSATILQSIYSDSSLPDQVQTVSSIHELTPEKEKISFIDPTPVKLDPDERGAGSTASGQSALSYLKTAVKLCKNHIADGIVTGPISKEWVAPHLNEEEGFVEDSEELSSRRVKGQTEWFAKQFASDPPVMGMKNDAGLVTLVTRHIPLKTVAQGLTEQRIDRTVQTTIQGVKSFASPPYRIGVCGLNPHAGEGGLLGSAEQEMIQPVVERYAKGNHQVEGPLSAETLMSKSEFRNLDAVVAMYHDQGLVPIKAMGLHTCTGVTLGLPIPRTSVSHGTGYELVNTHQYQSTSLFEAIKLAATLAHSDKTTKLT